MKKLYEKFPADRRFVFAHRLARGSAAPARYRLRDATAMNSTKTRTAKKLAPRPEAPWN